MLLQCSLVSIARTSLVCPHRPDRRKYTNKKHKTWDGDGILEVYGGFARLQDASSGREMGRAPCTAPLLPGSTLSIGGKEIEVDSILSKTDHAASKALSKPSIASANPIFKTISLPRPKPKSMLAQAATEPPEDKPVRSRPLVSTTLRTQTTFKTPLIEAETHFKGFVKEPTPRHDPSVPDAIVMKRIHSCPKDKQTVDVVVDPLIARHLREHQREGIKFLYECVMGIRGEEMRGAILADEMGLGKTLQTIALIWTLLKQNPIAEDAPVIKKALIVCPVTLINNWRKEFKKWLGSDRIGVYVFDDTKKRIADFTKGRAYSVMIIGYEKLRTIHGELKKGRGIDIVVADEGHRLKTAKNKSALAIKSLDTPMRVILSGTPIQNDLSEFFMMVDFVNPGLLGSYKCFLKEFETPIIRSRQPEATKNEKEKGEAKSEELASLTQQFILRRNIDILARYLPPKTEYVLLCKPTAAQASIYRHVLACPAFQSALGSPEAALQLITILKKVCNSPYLLNRNQSKKDSTEINPNPLTEALMESIPVGLLKNNQSSTKLRFLDQLLHTLRTTTSEKIVLVSNYTSTLDLLEGLVTSLSQPYVRLDGSTPSSKRQDIVDAFNRTPSSQCFAFLLSAKSGGVGLNLIGASRLVLFDVDWNPATDLQAMARIHRDGQKRPCVIYRFLMAGGMDEKIWQRQITKLGLASNIMEQKGSVSKFSREELKDLFHLDEGNGCQTHDLIRCKCSGKGLPDLSAAREDPVGETDEASDVDHDQSESDADLPSPAKLIPANKVDMEAQERRIAKIREVKTEKKSNQMDILLEYSHIDTSRFAVESDEDMEALIKDDILLDLLKDDGNRVNFLFAKTST